LIDLSIGGIVKSTNRKSTNHKLQMCHGAGELALRLQEGTMIRERALKVVLVLVGLLFLAGVYPLMQANTPEYAQMMLSIYVTLGVFLLLAVRNPFAHRSLIAFTAWSSFAHGAVMAVQASRHNVGERGDFLGGVLLFGIVGLALIVLAPAKSVAERVSAAA
jgi:FtsH-binding integral membrane protein